MDTINTTKRSDLLGTAMTAAKVAAGIIDDDRDHGDTRNLARAIDQLVQALAEALVARDMGDVMDSDDLSNLVMHHEREIRAALEV